MTTTHPMLEAVREFVRGVDTAHAIRHGLAVTRPVAPPAAAHSMDGGPAQPGGHTLYQSGTDWRP